MVTLQSCWFFHCDRAKKTPTQEWWHNNYSLLVYFLLREASGGIFNSLKYQEVSLSGFTQHPLFPLHHISDPAASPALQNSGKRRLLCQVLPRFISIGFKLGQMIYYHLKRSLKALETSIALPVVFNSPGNSKKVGLNYVSVSQTAQLGKL